MPEEPRPVQPDASKRANVGIQAPPRRAVSRLSLAAFGCSLLCCAFIITGRAWWRTDPFLLCGAAALCLGILAVPWSLETRFRALGLLLASFGMLVGAYSVLVIPATCSVRENARRAQCRSNLRQIGLAIHIYADDNGEVFPLSFQQLCPDGGVDNPSMFRVFSCPSEPSSWNDFRPGGKVTEKSSSYIYIPGLCAAMPAVLILAYDKSPENHRKEGHEGGRNVLFTDAHVEWWPVEREAEFQSTLAAQRAAVERWRKSGKPVESLPEFLGK